MLREFYKPNSIAEAVGLKTRLGADSYYIAGGTELNSLDFKKNINFAVSLEKLGLTKIIKNNEYLSIGAAVTLQNLIDNQESPRQLKNAAAHIVNRNIRNIGTIGGNIGANKSCSNLMPILLALDAELSIATTSGESSISLYDYISKENSELIVSINIRNNKLAESFAIKKYSRTANDISIITAAVVLEKSADKISNIAVALGGAAKHTLRLTELEKQIAGKTLPPKLDIENSVKSMLNPLEDIRGTIEFKKYAAAVMVGDCIYEAFNN